TRPHLVPNPEAASNPQAPPKVPFVSYPKPAKLAKASVADLTAGAVDVANAALSQADAELLKLPANRGKKAEDLDQDDRYAKFNEILNAAIRDPQASAELKANHARIRKEGHDQIYSRPRKKAGGSVKDAAQRELEGLTGKTPPPSE